MFSWTFQIHEFRQHHGNRWRSCNASWKTHRRCTKTRWGGRIPNSDVMRRNTVKPSYLLQVSQVNNAIKPWGPSMLEEFSQRWWAGHTKLHGNYRKLLTSWVKDSFSMHFWGIIYINGLFRGNCHFLEGSNSFCQMLHVLSWPEGTQLL